MGCSPNSPCGQKSPPVPGQGPGVIIPENQRYWITNDPRPQPDFNTPQVPLVQPSPQPKQD